MTDITFTIDGQSVTVPKGTTVYKACKQLGIEIPIFCYHDRMPPFGACRQCLVEVEKVPKLQTSCTLEATEGMVVRTKSTMAVDGREDILEFLLINHPLDCPICDKGGECPLQDQAIKFGPGESRFYEDKRHFTKALPLGPVLMLDRERCVVCARCTRFGDLIAGDHALELKDRGFKTEVGTPNGEPVQSKFIGNTISICPVGALTSDVYRFRARPWDNNSTNSTCTLCPVGCSMILDSRDGEIMRTRSRENHDLNDIWMCDKGWFGYEFSSNTDRLTTPLVKRNGQLVPTDWDEALALIATKFKEAKTNGKIAALGGDVLTVEESYLFQKFVREGGGVNHVDHRVGTPIFSLEEEGLAPGMEMSIGSCEDLKYAVLLGLDITEEFPVIWLRLKQAINKGATVIFLGHFAPEIAPHLSKTILHAPGQELEFVRQHLPHIAALAESGGNGAIFVGRQYLASPSRRALLAELQQFKHDKKNLALNIMEGHGNSMGARLAGMRPDLGPLGARVAKPGLNAVQILQAAAQTGWGYLHVAGADPVSKFPKKLWDEARAKLDFLVVQDLFLTKTAAQADVVLPTLGYVEKEGSFMNIEKRAQKLHPGKNIPTGVLSDLEIFVRLADLLGVTLTEMPKDSKPSTQASQISSSRVPEPSKADLVATFAVSLFDNGVRMKHNPHVIQLAKDPHVRLHPVEGVKRGLKSGDSIHLSANGQTILATIKLDERVALRTAVLPLGFDQIPVHDLAPNLLNGMEVVIAKV